MAYIQSFTGLTTAGTSSIAKTGESINHTFQFTVTTGAGTPSLYLQGSVDGVNWARLKPDTTTQTSLSFSNEVATLGAQGTYILNVRNTPLSAVRYVWSTGTATSLESKYMGE